MGFPVCSEPHRNLCSPARHRSHGKDNVQFPHSKRATNRSMEKLLYKILGSTHNFSCHWVCVRLLYKVSSYHKLSVCGVRHTTPNSSTLCYFLLIFPELIHHDHKLWVLLHPFTLFILKIYPKMVFHSYL